MHLLRRLIDWLTGKPKPPDDYGAEEEEAWYNAKSEFLAEKLGPEHDMVMHAIIPYAIGGGLDLYYYHNGIPGTGIATKELADARGRGPSNSVYDCYELVMFTRQALNLDDAQDETTPFGAAHATINAILNLIARYGEQATLNPHETCEFPADMEEVGGKCLVFDAYASPEERGPQGLGLLLILEVHRSEMEYAMEHGGAETDRHAQRAGLLSLFRPGPIAGCVRTWKSGCPAVRAEARQSPWHPRCHGPRPATATRWPDRPAASVRLSPA